MIDAGDSGDVEYADPVPDGSRTPAAWIARYIQHMMGDRPARIDRAILTHFHADHMGHATGAEPRSSHGDYRLNGLTELAETIPISTVIDRGWPSYDYVPPAPADADFANYRRFVEAQATTGRSRVEGARVGRPDQIVCRGCGDGARFEVRIVAANNAVWTGHGDETKTRFPALESIADPADRPTENMCSVALTVRYGRFAYFTGGDVPGYPVPGAPVWHDVETDIARAIGPIDVHAVNHHGSLEEENPFFLATLRSRVMIVPAWSPTHPSPDVLKRMLSTRVYPEPRDIFITEFREVMKAATGARASQVASDHGHVVVRVEPGGARYRVFVLDDRTESYKMLSVHGPYDAFLPAAPRSDLR